MEHPIKWYTVKVVHTDRVPFDLFGDLEKGSLYISAGGRLCGPGAAVYLKSKQLAEAYVLALTARRKRTDPHFSACVDKVTSSYEGHLQFVARDSQKVSEKLARWGIIV